MNENNSIIVGLSGGVDSAASIKLLIEKGYKPIGVYLEMLENTAEFFKVETAENLSNAQISAFQCAETYDIPLYIYNVKEIFEKYVISNFIEEYSNGRTPNPCTVCNLYCKIQSLIVAADKLCCFYVATGHYAKICCENERYFPIQAKDEKKDQSYMLWRLTQDQLKRLVLPLYEFTKDEVKSKAKNDKLFAAERKESNDICFIPDGDYASYIEKRVGKFKEGEFISPEGKVCGKHKGIIHYTVGQRKGMGIALGEPVFVLKIEAESNKIYLGKKGDENANSFVAKNLNFVLLPPTNHHEDEYLVKIRYAAKPVLCCVKIENDTAFVTFKTPQRSITPGQSAVFYKEDKVMFGAIIS